VIQRRVLVVFLVVLLASPTLSGSAQTPAASDVPAEDELAGLQASVWRSYAPAGAFVGRGTINLDEATPVSSVAGMTQLRSISVVVREFDTAENAASAFERISAGAEASVAGVFPHGTQDVTSEDLPDIGSQATLVRIDYTGQVSEVWLEYVTVQRDQYVFFVSADGSVFVNMPGSDDVDKSLPTVEIAAAIATNGHPSPNEPTFEPTFMEDGTSTGGLWGFMPPADDPLLMGLVPVQDSILYPNPGA
jgi:hypothetical protein